MIRGWLIGILALGISAQAEVPKGVPALLEATNGKQARVFLQGATSTTLSFTGVSSSTVNEIPVARVARLVFFPEQDAEQLEVEIGQRTIGVDALQRVLAPYKPYMAIPNNMQSLFLLQVNDWFVAGENERAKAGAAQFLACTKEERMRTHGLRYMLLLALRSGDLAEAKGLIEGLAEGAMRHYFEAEITAAEVGAKAAMMQVTQLIAAYANEVDWLAPTELLAAQLYLEMGMTNSALQTAHQVASIYPGSVMAIEAQSIIDQWDIEE